MGLNNAPQTKKLAVTADNMRNVPENPYVLNMISITGGNVKLPSPTPEVASPTAMPLLLLK